MQLLCIWDIKPGGTLGPCLGVSGCGAELHFIAELHQELTRTCGLTHLGFAQRQQ